MQSESRRKFIVILLALSCILATYLLIGTSPITQKKLVHSSQIDSLITLTLEDFNIAPNQVRKSDIQIDSVFSRSVYNIRVAPNFSKTTLHYTMKEELWPYRINPIAKVEFPDRDMRLHLLVNEQIYRTLIIQDDQDLILQQKQPEILPGQDSHEVD